MGVGDFLGDISEAVDEAVEIASDAGDVIDVVGDVGGAIGGGSGGSSGGVGGGGGLDFDFELEAGGGGGPIKQPRVVDYEIEKIEDDLIKFAETALTMDVPTLVRLIAALPAGAAIARGLARTFGTSADATSGIPQPSVEPGTAEVYAVQVSKDSPDLYTAIQLTRQGVDMPFGMSRNVVQAWQAMQVCISGTYVAPYGCDPKHHCEARDDHYRGMRHHGGDAGLLDRIVDAMRGDVRIDDGADVDRYPWNPFRR